MCCVFLDEMAKVLLFLFLFIILWDEVETNCNNYNKNLNNTQACPSSSSTGESAGKELGFIIGGFALFLSFCTCCCLCKGDREKSTDADVQTTRDDMTVVSSNTESGGYVNTAACPPGIHTPCPEYSHPATQEGFLGNYGRNIYLPQEAVLFTGNDDPPPPYTECELKRTCPVNNTSHGRSRPKYVT